MDGSLAGPRAHCAKHVLARHPRDVAHLLRVQRRTPAHVPPTTRPPRWRLGRWPDSVPEREVQELLKSKMRYGRPYILVRWTGLDAAGDIWEPLDNLSNCEDAIAAF